jgi:hypothetical protein
LKAFFPKFNKTYMYDLKPFSGYLFFLEKKENLFNIAMLPLCPFAFKKN